MLFKYKAIGEGGAESEGTIDAINVDIAINIIISLQTTLRFIRGDRP